MRRWIFFAVSTLVLMSMAGCETVKGLGRDIEGAGSAVQKGLSSPRKK